MIAKIFFTLKNLKRISYHHYGNSPFSIVKFIFFSFFRMNTFIVFECDLEKPLLPTMLDSNFKVIRPSMEELDRLRKDKDFPREFFYDQFHKVRTCYLALYEDEIAYIHWVYFKGDDSRFLKLREDAAEINYVTTLPGFRGKKLSSQMLIYTARSLQESGYKKLIIVVHENTIALIKNLKGTGFRETRRIKTIGPFNRKVQV